MNFYTPPGFCGDDYDDETDDLWNMPPAYTEAELEDMAAAMATECETCGGFGVLYTDCDIFDGVQACPDCTVPEPEPGIPFIAGVLQRRATATMELTDAQQEELYNAAVNDLVARFTIGTPRNDAERQTLAHASAKIEGVLARAA